MTRELLPELFPELFPELLPELLPKHKKRARSLIEVIEVPDDCVVCQQQDWKMPKIVQWDPASGW